MNFGTNFTHKRKIQVCIVYLSYVWLIFVGKSRHIYCSSHMDPSWAIFFASINFSGASAGSFGEGISVREVSHMFFLW